MGWRDFFRIKGPAAPPAPPLRHRVELNLKQAPAFDYLPMDPGNPLDAEVRRLWENFRRKHPGGTWSAFLADLAAANTAAAAEITKLDADLARYPPLDTRYRP